MRNTQDIRLECLKMARDILEQQYQATIERNLAKQNDFYQGKTSGYPLAFEVVLHYTDQDIKAKAEELFEFVVDPSVISKCLTPS